MPVTCRGAPGHLHGTPRSRFEQREAPGIYVPHADGTPGTSPKVLEHQGVCDMYQVSYLLPYIYICSKRQAGVILETGKLPLFLCFFSMEEHSYS